MPVPASITDLSTTPASNSPAGSESPTTLDEYLRTQAAFIAQLRDGSGFGVAVRNNVLGSAGAPAFSFVADTNTGVYSPTADTLALSTGGVERVRVDLGGNVGVGVSPSAWNSAWKQVQFQAGGAVGQGGHRDSRWGAILHFRADRTAASVKMAA